MNTKKKTKTKRAADTDVLDVELEVSTRGTITVEMTRAQYLEMKDNEHRGAICLDMVPNVDWSELTTVLDFEAEIFNVYDDGKVVDP